MTDRQLTTRDLAEPSDTDANTQANKQNAPDRNTLAEPIGNEETRGETAATDEPLARKRSENEREDGPLSNGPAEAISASRGANLPSTEPAQLERRPSNVEGGPLLPDDQSGRFTTRWQEIQASFVDQPRDSVEQADTLVADLMQRLAASFSNERERLEAQWDRGDDVSTEELRVALTRYRAFFDRLLSA
jgi:hypothetical protein